METIILNKTNVIPKQLVTKQRLIITDGTYVLAYRSASKRWSRYRFPGVDSKQDINLLDKINNMLNLDLKEEDIVGFLRTQYFSSIFEEQNNKLIPIVREIIRDYYVYYHSFDHDFVNHLRAGIDENWFSEPKIIEIASILNPANMISNSPFAKIEIPTYELQKRLKYEKY